MDMEIYDLSNFMAILEPCQLTFVFFLKRNLNTYLRNEVNK